MVARSDGKKSIEALDETFRVLCVELVLQEDPHCVHPDRLSQAKLAVVDGWVERGCLKHLQLIDRVGGHVIGADKPGLTGVPGVGRVFRPSTGVSGLAVEHGGKTKSQGKGKSAESHQRKSYPVTTLWAPVIFSWYSEVCRMVFRF
jgi:hypothetical protein